MMKQRRKHGFIGTKRTSKQKQKFAAVGVADQRVVAGCRGPPVVRNARVAGVNAEYSAHGRGVDEDRGRTEGDEGVGRVTNGEGKEIGALQ